MRKKLIICLLIFSGLSMGLAVFAEDPEIQTLVRWPRSPISQIQIHGYSELHELVAYIYEWGVTLGGLAVFIVMIFAGMQYLTSAGDPAKMRDARGRIQNAIMGLVFLLSIWLILYTINPALTVIVPLRLNLEKYTSCENDEECASRFGADYYICEDEVCVLDEEAFRDMFRPRYCEKINIKVPDLVRWPAEGENLWPGDDKNVHDFEVMEQGQTYIVEVTVPTNPNTGEEYDNCIVMLEIGQYRKRLGKTCRGDKELVTIQVTNPQEPENYIFRKTVAKLETERCFAFRQTDLPF